MYALSKYNSIVHTFLLYAFKWCFDQIFISFNFFFNTAQKMLDDHKIRQKINRRF